MDTFSIFKGLSKAYVDRDSKIEAIYPYHFTSREDLTRKISELDNEQSIIEKTRAYEAIRSYNECLGATEAVMEHIKELENDALAVVTGQQAGIFTGPLYTIYKAVTTIKLARKWRSELGRPVVPIFWIASEDHDFQEIQQLKHYKNGKIQTHKIEKQPTVQIQEHITDIKMDLKASIGHLGVTEGIRELLEQLIINESGNYAEQLADFLNKTIKQEDSLSDWFGRMMMHLFHDYGLIMVDPMLEGIRQAEVPFFLKVIEEEDKISMSVRKMTEIIESAGFAASLDYDEDGLNLFFYKGGERLPLKRHEVGWKVVQNGEDVLFSVEELKRLVLDSPSRFSTNVVLRPVIQDHLFKTISYIGGPGEISYYAQLKEVYGVFGKSMPVLYPRENFTLIDMDSYNSLNDWHVDPLDILLKQGDQIKDRLLDEKDDIKINDIFHNYIKQVTEGYDDLVSKVSRISPEIYDITEKNRGMILSQIAYLQDKAHRFHRRNHKDLIKAFTDIETLLKPEGELQERTLSVIQFYGTYGSKLIEMLIEDLPLDIEHRIIRL